MSEEMVIRHCSPTLAGMKTGSMFSCSFGEMSDLRSFIRRLNQLLVKKGLRVLPLRIQENRALIYVFRPKRLKQDLNHVTSTRLLKERQYDVNSPDRCILHLMQRLKENEEFPHEIGLFLGYPPEDVLGFIENKAQDYKLSGLWKVYGDEETAKKRFDLFKKCDRVYYKRWSQGTNIERLTVAA